MPSQARQVALKCLLSCEKQRAWSDGYLRNVMRQAQLDSRDSALCTQLAFGVTQNRLLLDWHIARLCSIPLPKLESAVVNCLRLGLYQMLFLDRVPVHAAVNESVELTRANSRNPRCAGLVNGVLRAFAREGAENHPQPAELSTRYSHPKWLVEEFAHLLPAEELDPFLAANNLPPPVQAQVNSLKTTAKALMEELEGTGITVRPHPWLENCLELEGAGNLEHLPAFQDGKFYVQDAAARLAVLAAGLEPGMTVLDACAAPGGKSFAAAIAMGGDGKILSCDLHPHKIKLIEAGAARLGMNCITARTMDAKTFEQDLEGQFDAVIVDAPCSGLGIIRKKPDIRYKASEPLEGLPQVQQAIVANTARYVRPGGVLLYATCTLLPRENEDVVARFLEDRGDFTLESVSLPAVIGRTKGMVTLWPHRHGTDGFFIARLRRKA